ncbi:major facilitator superfamily domain-containing protein [Fennellomyces sp. T-0311]|nr:major facilitator superfamily domain-containing protein [Fennellomyces sp. T-0311]
MSDELSSSSPSSDEDERPYTIFSRWQKAGIITIVAFAGILSPLSSNIYFPALTSIEQDLGITAQQVNLTVTVYMVFQGLSPILCGTFSDTWGRRPVYLITIVIYLCGCIGCARAPSFAVLLIFRMIQSSGSSPVASIGAGIVSDIAVPSERGTFFGVYSSVHVIGPVLGPVMGGYITMRLSWRFTFWILMLVACILWLAVFILLPETLRTLVGDGSGYANPTPVQWLRKRLLKRRQYEGGKNMSQRRKFPNPFLPLKYLTERDVAVALMYNTFHYAVYCCYTTSTSSLFSSVYKLNELETGLCFLSPGMGCLLGSLVEGRALDHNFRITELRHKYTEQRPQKIENLSEEFPVFSARFRTAWIHAPLVQLVTIVYGWSLHVSAPLPIPLALQFIVGFSVTGLYTAVQTLLIDLFPDNGATITAANNFIRCFIGAAATAAIQPGIDGVNVGWMFTILGLILAVTNVSVPILIKFGPIWRKKRMNKCRERT